MTAGMTFRRALPIVLLIFSLPGLPGWSATQNATQNTQASSSEIKVGLIAPMTGMIPSFGESVRNGVDLAIREWNDRGGILGKMIVLDVADGQCEAGFAVDAVNKLIEQDGVHYVIGEVCSAASIPVSEIADAAGVIQITPTSTNPAVTVDHDGRVKPFIFRACFIDSWQGVIGARFAWDNLGARRVFVLRDPHNTYVSSLCESFIQEFQRLGGTVSGDESYDGSNSNDFAPRLSLVRKSGADLAYLPDYYNVVNFVTGQAKKMGLAIPFLGGDGWDSPDLDASAADGSFFTNHFSADDPEQEVQDFVSAYRGAFAQGSHRAPSPDVLAALAYDSAQLLFQAIAAAGADDPVAVGRALENIRFRGVTGVLTFDSLHNPVKSGVVMAVRKTGMRFETSIDP